MELDEYRAAEVVSAFALDMAADDPFYGATQALQLTHETFFKRLYVHLPALEREIRSYIDAGIPLFLIRGSAGKSKTTMTRKVLRDLRIDGFQVIQIDFRSIEQRSAGSCDSLESFYSWMHSKLLQRLDSLLHTLGLSRHSLIPSLAHASYAHDYDLDPAAQRALSSLRNQFDAVHMQRSLSAFTEWLEDPATMTDAHSAPHRSTIADNMTPHDIMRVLPPFLAKDDARPRPLVLLFDNLDSIWCMSIRQHFEEWLITSYGRASSTVITVASVRPENGEVLLPLLTKRSDERRLDHDSIDVPVIDLSDSRYFALATETSVEGSESHHDDEGPKGSSESFDAELVARRLEYLQEGTSTRAEWNLSTLTRLDAIVRELSARQYRRLAREIGCLANGNGREKLRYYCKLAEHLIREYDVEALSQGERPVQQRRLLIESAFYEWLPQSSNLRPALQVLDLVAVTEYIRGGDVIVEDGIDKWLHPFRHFLVLYSIWALNDISVFEVATHRARGAVCEEIERRCCSIGMTPSVVRRTIRELLGTGRSTPGLLESTRYHAIREGAPIENSDMFVITTRAWELAGHLAYRLTYLAAVLGRRRVMIPPRDRAFRGSSGGDVATQTLEDVLAYLRLCVTYFVKMCRSAMNALAETQPAEVDAAGHPRVLFTKWFGLDSGDLGGSYRATIIDRVLMTHSKFIQRCQEESVRQGSDHDKRQLGSLLSDYELLRKSVLVAIEDLSHGKRIVIPDGPWRLE